MTEQTRARGNPALRWAWTLVAAGALGLAVVVPLAVWTQLGQRADERSRWAVALPLPFRETLWDWLEQVSVPLIAGAALAAVVVALARRRPEQAFAAVFVIGAANVTTQIAKSVLPRASFGIGTENTLPSGHMTVVASLLVAAVLVLPRALRFPMVGAASFLGTLAGAAIVILRWHRPSDVVAAVGVCALWYGLAIVIAEPWARRRRVREAGIERGRHSAGSGVDRPHMPHLSGHPRDAWDEAAETAEPHPGERGRAVWHDRIVSYFVLAIACAGLAGGVLILGGLAAQEQPGNAVVGAITLSAAGIAVAALMSMGASAADGLDAPARAVAEPRTLRSSEDRPSGRRVRPDGQGGDGPIWAR